jgi:glucose-1-phosphate thymidylyltransferase
MLQAANYIQVLEERQGLMVACLEEVAFKMGFLSEAQVRRAAERMASSDYGQYLLRMLDEPEPRDTSGA